MDIEGLGDELARMLYDRGLVSDAGDLYLLDVETLLRLPAMGETAALNFLFSVEASKNRPASRVLTGLGIKHIGPVIAESLIDRFGDVESVLNARHEDLMSVEGSGDAVADSITTWIGIGSNQAVLSKLHKAGVRLDIGRERDENQFLSGLTIVITGRLSSISRDELKASIARAGGKSASAVGSKTSFVVAGEKPTEAKIKKAESLGVQVVTEDDILAAINEKTLGSVFRDVQR